MSIKYNYHKFSREAIELQIDLRDLFPFDPPKEA